MNKNIGINVVFISVRFSAKYNRYIHFNLNIKVELLKLPIIQQLRLSN